MLLLHCCKGEELPFTIKFSNLVRRTILTAVTASSLAAVEYLLYRPKAIGMVPAPASVEASVGF